MTLPSLAVALALLAVVLLRGWLVLSSRLAARLDQVLAECGWAPVAHPLARVRFVSVAWAALSAVVQPNHPPEPAHPVSVSGSGWSKKKQQTEEGWGESRLIEPAG